MFFLLPLSRNYTAQKYDIFSDQVGDHLQIIKSERKIKLGYISFPHKVLPLRYGELEIMTHFLWSKLRKF